MDKDRQKKINRILKQKELPLQDFLQLVREEAWIEDTSFEDVPAEDGGIHIEEHVWSMNSEHSRVLISIDKDGQITDTGGLEIAEMLRDGHVRII